MCVDEDGRVVTPSLAAAPGLVVWWKDPRLELNLEGETCPPLTLSRTTGRNDTLYLAWVVGLDGRAEVEGLEIESTAGFDAAMGAVHLLEGCRFHPARLAGRPVRSHRRQAIPLAPASTKPPTYAVDTVPPGLVNPFPRPPGAVRETRELLAALVAAQEVYRTREGRYAASPTRALGAPPRTSAVWIAQISWSPDGWAAIARHDSIPWVHCRVDVAAGGPTAEVKCRDETDSLLVSDSAEEETAPTPVPKPPERRSCKQFSVPSDRPARSTATLELLIGRDGKPDPRYIRVLEATDFWSAGASMQQAAGCRYSPGSWNGRAIPTIVRQPFTYSLRR
jgi:hypothetical protein